MKRCGPVWMEKANRIRMTVAIAKEIKEDRGCKRAGHNPLVPLYLSHSYYRRLLRIEPDILEEMKIRLVSNRTRSIG